MNSCRYHVYNGDRTNTVLGCVSGGAGQKGTGIAFEGTNDDATRVGTDLDGFAALSQQCGCRLRKPPTFDVTGPDHYCVLRAGDRRGITKDSDTNTVLSDFQFHAGQVREPLANRGITFKEVYADAFTIRQEKSPPCSQREQ